MSDKEHQLYNRFDPYKHKEKFWCNECNCIWFSRSGFDDLCPHCESEHIFSHTITEEDIKKYHKRIEKIQKLQLKSEKIRSKILLLPGIKRKG